MTIWEAGIVVGVMLLLLAGHLGMQADVIDADEARLRARMIERLHGGVEEYLRSEYAFLERCLDAPSLEERWNGESSGGQAGPFKAVRLYSAPADIADMPRGDHEQALTEDPDDLRCVSHDAAVTAYPGAPRSLDEAGFLPAELSRLSYEAGADESSNLWRRLDFRLMVRVVNLSRGAPDASAIPPAAAQVGLQAVLVVQARRGEGLFEREAGAVLRAMTIGEGGLLRGRSVGVAFADRTIAGTGGAWRMELCDESASGVAVSCAAAQHQLVIDDLLGSQVIRVEDDASRSPVRRAFVSGDPAGQRVSGSLAGASPAARVVTVATIGRDEALRNVLYRVDIGIPEANRMETDIDMGGYGLLNVAYVTGVDIDGDGLVDRGVGLMGPPNDGPDDDGRRRNPVTVYGDLHVRGALHVGAGGDEEAFATNIPAGSVWAAGGVQAGADAFDADLPGSSLLAQQGMQVGGGEFAMTFDVSGTEEREGGTEGSVWIRGATQVGDVRKELDPGYDTDVPAGGLLTGGEIRSSGGMRAVGPEIMLAASTDTDDTDVLRGRAALNRGWEAVATGLGNILDPELSPGDTTADTYAGDGGRLQFRTEGDRGHVDSGTLHMVANSAALKVVPQSIADMDKHMLRDLHHYEGDVGIEVEGKEGARIIVDSADVWIQDEHRNVEVLEDKARMLNRTLHDALPRYVSRRFEWNKSYSIRKDADDNWEAVVAKHEEECADGGTQRDVLIPNGWARKDFAGTAQAVLVVAAIPPYYTFPITFEEDYVQTIYVNHHLPYTGWAIDPETGKDAAGNVPADGLYSTWGILGPANKWRTYSPSDFDRELATDYRRTIYCDYRK